MPKKVLITGSSRGIGADTARYLAKNGYDIVLHCSKNPERLNSLADELKAFNVNIDKISFDISNRAECARVLEKELEKGCFWAVILNAGINADSPFPSMEDDMWDRVIDTNLGGFYNVLKPVIMAMIQQRKGRIVTMSSVSALAGNRGQVNYSASKAGIIGATKALSRELAKRKITVNCVAPGIIDSDMTSELDDKIISELVPMKRKGTGLEVASLINYLISEDAGYITGQVISVNGGMYL